MQNVAAIDLGPRQDRNVDGSGAASDLVEVDTPRKIGLHQLEQRLAIVGLVGQHDIDGFRGHIQQLGIGNFVAVFAQHLDQRFSPAGHRDDIPLLQGRRRCELHQLAVTTQTLDEYAGVPVVGLGAGHGHPARHPIADLVGSYVGATIR
jgi:hypothetical protein